MTALVVVFVARCPSCGRYVRWTQSSDGNAVRPADFTFGCACK